MADISPQLSEPADSIPFESPSSDEGDMDMLSEDGQHYLSDSTYEIISQSSFHTDDDDDDELREDGTDSMLSFGVPTPESSSIGDEDPIINPGPQLSTPSLDMTPDQSILSTDTVREPDNDWIKFDEPIPSFARGLLDVSTNRLPGSIPETSTQNSAAVEMTLANHTVKLNGPFRIMFCATDSEGHLKEPILEKIGQALHISSATKKVERAPAREKLNIVPISSFSDEQFAPEVVLVPFSELQIEVQDCSSNNGGAVLGEEKENLCSKPDLAIFVHRPLSGDVESVRSDLRRSSKFKKRGIPTIDICNDLPAEQSSSLKSPLKHSEIGQLDFKPSKNQAVHMSYRIAASSGDTLIMAPIDHSTFQSIDSVELNKNIAAIIERDSILDLQDAQWFMLSMGRTIWLQILHLCTFLARISRIYSMGLFSMTRSAHAEFVKPWSRQLYSSISNVRKEFIAAFIFGLLCCSSLWLYQHGASLTIPQTTGKLPITTSRTVVSTPLPTMRKTLEAPILPRLLSGPPKGAETRALAAVQHGRSLSTVPTAKKPAGKAPAKAAPEFKLIEAKDGRLFLQSIRVLPRKWKAPGTFVFAHQNGASVSISFSKIWDTTFELELGENQPCIPVVLMIHSDGGKSPSQVFEIPRACQRIASMETLSEALADASSRASSIALALRDTMYQHASTFSEDSLRSMNEYYAEWAPEVSQKMKESWAGMKKFSERAEEVRHSLNKMADERLDLLARRITTRAEELGSDLANRFATIGTDAHRRFELARQRAQQLQRSSLSRNFQSRQASAWSSKSSRSSVNTAQARVAKIRATRIGEKMLLRKAKIWDWVAQARRKVNGRFQSSQRERLSHRSGRCGRRR